MKAHHLKVGEEYRYTQKFVNEQGASSVRRFIFLEDSIIETNIWYLFRWKMKGRKEPLESYFSVSDISTLEPT